VARSNAPEGDAAKQPNEDTVMATRVQLEEQPVRRRPRAQPKQVGRFVIDRRLGVGGMGVVFEGHDPKLGRKVAIKLLHEGAGDQTRLLREAQALAQLTHENVVQVYEIDTDGDQVFVAMQFIAGQTLGQWIGERERSWQEIVAMFAGAGAGLVAAHAKGIVHRDFKPDNVLVGSDGVPRVLDFGLARAAKGEGRNTGAFAPLPGSDPDSSQASAERSSTELASPTTAPLSPSSSNPLLAVDLTRTGSIMGTPAYMSPEQAAGLPVDEGSDQFSFCVALYEALYGQRPFAGSNLAALIDNLSSGRIRPRPADTKVPEWLHAALLRGLSPNPEDRFESVAALLAELSSYRNASLQVGSKARAGFLAIALLVLFGALGGNVIAVRLFDATVTPGSTLPGSAVAIVVLLVALLALRKPLRRSGVNRRIFGCFFVYIFYGPAIRLAAWRLDLSMDQMMPLELLGASLAGFFFAFGLDGRMLWPAFVLFLAAIASVLVPARALEFHAFGYFEYFGYLAVIWYRDGMPKAER
jgi:predicted Ser/Thr protein kinase